MIKTLVGSENGYLPDFCQQRTLVLAFQAVQGFPSASTLPNHHLNLQVFLTVTPI